MNELVEFNNFSFRYELGNEDALKSITYSFEPGMLYGVIGSNGSGKTTLCNAIKGLIPSFYSGSVEGDLKILGKPLQEWDPRELSYQIGYVFQNPFTQISGIKDTVFEEVAVGLENLGIPKDEIISRVMNTVKEVGIEELIQLNPNELSGGQRQRVAFASIIVMDNDLFVIDEPTSQLDPEGTEIVFNIIEKLKDQQKAIILVEHKVDRLAEYADKMIVLHEGEIVFQGDTREVLTNYELINKDVLLPQAVLLSKSLNEKGCYFDEIPITSVEAIRQINKGLRYE